jgi:predicted nuclease of predicted toxin-antitoxin system
VRLLADENFPGAVVKALKMAGHDVVWVRETHRGIGDKQVLAWATTEARILVTFDKDFGELAFKSKLRATSGVILFRIRKQSPEVVASRAVKSLAARSDWAGHFSVVEDERLRMTKLPE